MADFKIGDEVTWTPSVAGISRTKVGEVVAVVPEGEFCNRVVARYGLSRRVDGPGRPRAHRSFVVRVDRRLYWPRVSLLKAAGEERRP